MDCDIKTKEILTTLNGEVEPIKIFRIEKFDKNESPRTQYNKLNPKLIV